MQKRNHLRKLIASAVCIAFCVVLPLAFHSIPNSGQIFSPMHIPVFLSALICGPVYGAAVGAFGVLFSSVLFQMPPAALAPAMAAELVVYGLVVGTLFLIVKTKNQYLNLYISLVSGMLLGRIAAGILKAFVFMPSEFNITVWLSAYFVVSLPGIIVQLIAVPIVYFALKKAKLIF